jgi:tetratricopeptide (TPR) repeat protein
MPLSFRVALLLLAQSAASQSSLPTCTSAAHCNTRGTQALQALHFDAAVEDYKEELRYAEDGMAERTSPATAPAVRAFNNLSVAQLQQHHDLEARFWARQALELDPKSAAAAHNLAAAENDLRNLAWPASPNGLYVQYIGCGEWNQIRITGASAASATLAFEGMRIGAKGCHSDSGPAALGELEGEIALRGTSALYRGSGQFVSCKIQLQMKRDRLAVTEEGECGFGYGVRRMAITSASPYASRAQKLYLSAN